MILNRSLLPTSAPSKSLSLRSRGGGTAGKGRPLGNLVEGKSVPSLSRRPCGNILIVQSGGDPIESHTRRSKFSHPPKYAVFTRMFAKRLVSLTAAHCRFHALAALRLFQCGEIVSVMKAGSEQIDKLRREITELD